MDLATWQAHLEDMHARPEEYPDYEAAVKRAESLIATLQGERLPEPVGGRSARLRAYLDPENE